MTTRELFHLWHLARAGPMPRAELITAMAPIQTRVEALLAEGTCCGHAKTEKTCKRILKLESALWTFITTPGVEPTNNFAERLLRAFVLWRKNSFGTQSERGNRFVERMLSVTTTCRLQDRNVLEYLSLAIIAHLRHEPPPSLLPAAAADVLDVRMAA